MFSSDLTEGSSVQVLCGVSSGDKPMYFSWLKDGAPLPSSLQVNSWVFLSGICSHKKDGSVMQRIRVCADRGEEPE